MGYQESWLYIRPQCYFDRLTTAYARAKLSGHYDDPLCTLVEPMSVVTLKQPFGRLPAGTNILWVCGERSGHSVGHIFGEEAASLPCLMRIEVIPVEAVLGYRDPRLAGIDFCSDTPTENAFIHRQSAAICLRRLSEEPDTSMGLRL